MQDQLSQSQKRILVANRGEIALRIIHTLKEMNFWVLGLYTQDEIKSPYLKLCDDVVLLEGEELRETFINIPLILKIVKTYKIDFVHPGYGLLSENPEFAKSLTNIGVIFIGPSWESMIQMGLKSQAKEYALKYSIPCIPGFSEPMGQKIANDILYQEAVKIGFPVLIKASAGGGGKGMKVAFSASEFQSVLDSARRESLKSFGNDEVILEKYLQNPSHIEIQIIGDQYGHVEALYERECSIQRRHQKIIEETPSPQLTPKIREKMMEAAKKLGRQLKYQGVGTVEFIFEEGQFYFLEMNTRLQVEHPITERLCQIDLVKWQVLMSMGEKCRLPESVKSPRGHHIELRICAENPDQGFLPTLGTLHLRDYLLPSEVRVDCALETHQPLSARFDSMIAKVIVSGSDRKEAIDRAKYALKHLPFVGIVTNTQYLSRILKHPAFIDGKTTTPFVEIYKNDLKFLPIIKELEDEQYFNKNIIQNNEPRMIWFAHMLTMCWLNQQLQDHSFQEELKNIYYVPLDPFSMHDSSGKTYHSKLIHLNEKESLSFLKIKVVQEKTSRWIDLLNLPEAFQKKFRLQMLTPNVFKKNDEFYYIHSVQSDENDDISKRWHIVSEKISLFMDFIDRDSVHYLNHYSRQIKGTNQNHNRNGQQDIKSPMPGKLIQLLVKEGDEVREGDVLCVMEAMKMEHFLKAEQHSKVDKVFVTLGDILKNQQKILSLVSVKQPLK